ncbi:MAG: hypothetical protein MK066_00235 [Crocinitomicaceae bacterium]|nr:hypothetical protein [Crocinitomicaceae bacterium]
MNNTLQSTAINQTVLVFKTSVKKLEEINILKSCLNELTHNGRWNFDLEDCDNILKVVSNKNLKSKIISALTVNGFYCEELND